MKNPTENAFKHIAEDFWLNIPNCTGGIDGKHIRLRAPKKSGSLFINYNDYFSLELLAVVDVNCKFVAIDVSLIIFCPSSGLKKIR